MTEPKPRRITTEARAAETELYRFTASVALEDKRHHRRIMELDGLRRNYIEALPDDVRNMLVAGGVIEQ